MNTIAFPGSPAITPKAGIPQTVGLVGWIRGVLPETPSQYFERRRIRALQKHISTMIGNDTVRLVRHERGLALSALGIASGQAQAVSSRIYSALRTYHPRGKGKFYYALSVWCCTASDDPTYLIEQSMRVIDHNEEYDGYFFLDGHITKPMRRFSPNLTQA